MLRYTLICWICWTECAGLLRGQNPPVTIPVVLLFGQEKIEAGKKYACAGGDSISFTALRFYMGLQHGQHPFRYHLIDIEDPASLQITFDQGFSNCHLMLGVDSLTHTLGPLPGALDPVHGMYWTWQTGYIFFKIEGYHTASPARNHQFEFHLGGYQKEEAAFQLITIPMEETPSSIALNLKPLMDAVDWKTYTPVMSPGPKAVGMMLQLTQLMEIR